MQDCVLIPQVFQNLFEKEHMERHEERGDDLVSRALKSRNLWLTLTYVGVILLMARAYA